MASIVVWSWRLCLLLLAATAGAALTASGVYLYLAPRLPSVAVLRDVKFQEPLRVYSGDGLLIGEFGEMRRTPVGSDQIPDLLAKAILAAEDDRFLEHRGVDLPGLARAGWELVTTRHIQSGGSTITMQVARNYFLSREQSFIRKFNEILLALRIERELDKQQILELYLNQIFLGYRAYGVEAAAQVYYGRSIAALTLPEFATIAALPKAPSALNPLDNPTRCKERRDWILGRMRTLDYIDDATWQAAVATPETAALHGSRIELDAGYAAEMARSEMLQRYGRGAYLDGYVVQTTLDGRLQAHAQDAVLRGLLAYDARHGWRGPEKRLGPAAAAGGVPPALVATPAIGALQPAVVTAVREREIDVLTREGTTVSLRWEQGLGSSRPYISPDYRGPSPKTAAEVVAPGDVVRLMHDGAEWRLAQVPAAEAALVSIDADDGAIRALVGGIDFRRSKFNRVTQAQRQPGSNIKPFIYAAAMQNGFTPASIINDAPIVFQDEGLEKVWRPENDTGKFYGPTSLRTALVNSRNLVSIRLLQQLGVDVAVEYLARLGFKRESLPPNLSLALGTLTVTPLELISAYAMLANGGYQVKPYLISEIRQVDGTVIARTEPAHACADCSAMPTAPAFDEARSMDDLLARDAPVAAATAPASAGAVAPRPMDPRVAFMIDSILKDAIRHGTGRRALELKRTDVAGKTGTTNGPNDAWFSGYVGTIVTTAWLGFDQNHPLGRQEYGGSAALPIWVDYMREATRDLPPQVRLPPEGLVSVRIDPRTGLLATPGQRDAAFEYFMIENTPTVTPDGDEYQEPAAPDEYNSHQIF